MPTNGTPPRLDSRQRWEAALHPVLFSVGEVDVRSHDVFVLLGVLAALVVFTAEVRRRGAWDDRLIDALCDPPESFVISSVVAHVLTYSAHRRQLARQLLRASGQEVDSGDPINWLRAQRGGVADGDDV